MAKGKQPLFWEDLKKPWQDIIQAGWELIDNFVSIFGISTAGRTRKEYQNIYNQLEDDKKKKVVKLICMVKGRKIEEEKEVEDFEISIDDIDLVLERAKKLRPQLFVENIGE